MACSSFNQDNVGELVLVCVFVCLTETERELKGNNHQTLGIRQVGRQSANIIPRWLHTYIVQHRHHITFSFSYVLQAASLSGRGVKTCTDQT